ncbi:MAG: signal peptidase I [Armatimonadota bacterium]
MHVDIAQTEQRAAVVVQKSDGALLVRRGLLTALLAVFLFLVFFFYNFQTVLVDGHSMEPTLKDKQRILVCKALWLVGAPKKGDIVVVRGDVPGDYLVKRVYATEGQQVDYAYQPENYDFSLGKYVVPEGHVYVLGDNLSMSEDSREFGPVPLRKILGKVVEY